MGKETENVCLAMFNANHVLNDELGNVFITNGEPRISFNSDAPLGGKYLNCPANTYLVCENEGFAVETGDFTLDAYMYNTGEFCCIGTVTNRGKNGIGLWVCQNRVAIGIGYVYAEYLSLPDTLNQWAHYAVVRKNGVLYSYVNGKLTDQKPNMMPLQSTRFIVNSAYSNNETLYCAKGNYYQAIRFCSFARWENDFVPPAKLSNYLRTDHRFYLKNNAVYGMRTNV